MFSVFLKNIILHLLGREFTVSYYSKLLRNGKETHGFNYTNSTSRLTTTTATSSGPFQTLNRWRRPNYNNNNS